MKLTIDATALREALGLSVAAKSTTLPILAHALLENQGVYDAGSLKIVTTSLDEEVTATVRCYNDTCGSTAVNAQDLRNAISGLTGDVELIVENNQLKVTQNTGHSRRTFQLDTLSPDDFPLYGSENAAAFDFDVDVLAEALGTVRYAAAKNDVRHYLNGVFVGKDCVVGTDGHRAAIYPHSQAIEHGLIIPTASVDRLLKTLGRDGAKKLEVFLSIDRKAVALCAESDGLRHIIKLVDARYPDVLRTIPNGKPINTAQLFSAELLPILDRCIALELRKLEKTTTAGLNFVFEKNMVRIRGQHTDDFAEIDSPGEATLSLEGRYLRDVLLLDKQSDVNWTVYGYNVACKLDFGGEAVHLIMPMRL